MKIVNIKDKWLVVYFTYNDPLNLIIDTLSRVSKSNANWIKDVYDEINYGFTYSIPNKKTSIVFIGKATSKSEYLDTLVHELKHVLSHICEYYDVDESGEEAAYLIGYLTKLITL